jgi:single-stranded DNA-specific DHH superfamily exonuclease
MLTKKQVEEIKEHLERAQNPVFFFDNDPDGLCSFLILRRYCGKGRGVQVRSYPSMNKGFFRRS